MKIHTQNGKYMFFNKVLKLIKLLLATILYYTGICAVRGSFLQQKRALGLMYHRVLSDTDSTENIHPGMYVTKASFEKQLQFLMKKYTIVTLDELMMWLRKEKKYKKPPCVITFDDGWRDNYINAFPLLVKYSIPATIFLVTDKIGNDKDMLTWEQINIMQQKEIAFGSHTATHKILTESTNKEIENELKYSAIKLHSKIIKPSDWFCYPKGKYDEAVCEMVKTYYGAAMTVNRGFIDIQNDLYKIPRIGIHNDVSWSIPLFACRVSLML